MALGAEVDILKHIKGYLLRKVDLQTFVLALAHLTQTQAGHLLFQLIPPEEDNLAVQTWGGAGGSGGGAAYSGYAGSNGANGGSNPDLPSSRPGGIGQGSTTKDFGEADGGINAGGGSGEVSLGSGEGGYSDYTEGRGGDFKYGSNIMKGGGGYGGGGGAARGGSRVGGRGGDGTVLIRYLAY